MEPLIDAWRIHDRIHRYLLDAIGVDALATPLEKGKAVGPQFSHIHNARLLWLKSAAPDRLEGLTRLGPEADFDSIVTGLAASGEAIVGLLQDAGTPDGRVKGFKPHAAAFISYLIAHEAHHRGQIEIALRQAGNPIPDKIMYGMWEWGVR